MINLTKFFKETLILIILTLTVYAIHFTLVKDNIYNSKNILTSIYFFNFLLVLLLLIFFKISSIVLNFNHLSLFIILTIVTSSLLLNLLVYFWLLPKQVTKFSNSISNFTYEINKIQKYENEIDDINVKFNNIYSTIENLCELDILKKYCTNITNT